MRTLLMADIHGNFAALRAILSTPEAQSCGRVISLGDQVNFGPESRKVVETLRSLGATMLMGNHEERLLHPDDFAGYNWAMLRVTARQLSGISLADLPVDVRIGSALLTHGTPGDPYHLVYPPDLPEVLKALPEDVSLLISGHNHLCWDVTSGHRRAFNPGSAGLNETGTGDVRYLGWRRPHAVQCALRRNRKRPRVPLRRICAGSVGNEPDVPARDGNGAVSGRFAADSACEARCGRHGADDCRPRSMAGGGRGRPVARTHFNRGFLGAKGERSMSDTIAAIATAPGQGGIAIVRVSGDMAEDILRRIFRPVGGKHPLPTHLLTYGYIVEDEERIDECMAVIMRAPKSYTREDVVEFQLHGGGCVAQKVLALCLSSGARLAQPGEFTRRAFLNGRIDLSQAEAVMDLIAAQGEQSRKAAMRQLTGGASSFIRKAADELYAIQAGVAACIDYPEEISEEEAASDLAPRIAHLAKTLTDACDERAARLLQSGLRVALCGQPNVGKSSLLNALLGEEKAIVTAIPGTTRDLVEGTLMLSGSVIHLTDTAGLHDTDDPVERIGVDRARRALADADVVLLVLDMSRPLTNEDESLLRALHGRNGCIVLNKSDLPPVLTDSDLQDAADGKPILTVSASVPDSLQPLKSYLASQAAVSDQLTLTQPRHIAAARRAVAALHQAEETLRSYSVDLAGVDLQQAQMALAEITGDEVEEKLLDEVFGRFCVGK